MNDIHLVAYRVIRRRGLHDHDRVAVPQLDCDFLRALAGGVFLDRLADHRPGDGGPRYAQRRGRAARSARRARGGRADDGTSPLPEVGPPTLDGQVRSL